MFIILSFQTETVINLQDEEGFTPLMWAAAHGQIAVVEFLLQNVRVGRLNAMFLFFCVWLVLLKCFSKFTHRVLTPTSWPKGGKVRCPWPAARDTPTSSRCSLTAESTLTNTTGWERYAVCDGIKYDSLGLVSKYWETCGWCLNIVVVLFLWLLSERRSPSAVCSSWEPCALCGNIAGWVFGREICVYRHVCMLWFFRKCVESVKSSYAFVRVFQKAALIRPLSPILGSTQWTWPWPWAIEMVRADHRHSTFGNEIWNAG